jgi:hypothetical protein
LYRSKPLWWFLLGYFFSMVTVFTAAMALLISFDDSRMITHNPHPVIVVPAIVTIPSDDRHLPGSVQGQSARYTSAEDAQSSRTVAGSKTDTKRFRNSAVAKAELKKNERKRLADASKMLARFGTTRESHEGPRLRIALGYAEGSGYHPGLDSQR